MPSSMLFGINNEGRVYSLYTNGTKWREFPYLGVEFKSLSSVPHFLWAVGGDRQIYVHVHGFDIPIRIKEEVYENQRWNPIEGFVARLLPTDRYQWSSKDGTDNRTLEKIRLPSSAWEWEAHWALELSLEGQPLDDDGWTYAVDFPNSYTATKTWSCGVRRRKWFRYRKYSAMNAWCAVAPLYQDPTKEPFIDVCVGGHGIPGDGMGSMLVWAVTAQGRLMFRSGVTRSCPEGKHWHPVTLPSAQAEVRHIACGITGLTWLVLWSGELFVRTGVGPDCLMGSDWVEVPTPDATERIVHVAVGSSSVWTTSDKHTVWFRRGVSSQIGDSGVGTSWIQMSGRMTSVSVAPNDQVWGIGVPDQRVYYRSGVTLVEVTGRSWRAVKAPVQLSRYSTQSNSLLSLGAKSSNSSMTEETDWDEEEGAKSAPTRLVPDTNRIESDTIRVFSDSRGSETSSVSSDQSESLTPKTMETTNNNHEINVINQTDLWTNKSGSFSSSVKYATSADCIVVKNSRLWCPVRSGGSLLGMEVNPDGDDSGLDIGTERDAFQEKQNESLAVQLQTKWARVEAGAVEVSPSNLPRWFLQESTSLSLDERESWRSTIWTRLTERKAKLQPFQYIRNAIEITSCSKLVQSRCVISTSNVRYEDATIKLEWNGIEADVLESATVDIITHDKKCKELEESKALNIWQINMRDVTNVQSSSEPHLPRISMYLVGHVTPVLYVLATDADHDDLLSNMIYVCCCLNRIRSSPSSSSFWATTRLGEVLTFDPLIAELFQAQEKGLFCQMFNLNGASLPVTRTLANSFPPGSQLTVTGSILKSASRFAINLECGSSDFIALHINPRFDQNQIVRNHYYNGLWGMEDTYGPLGMDVGTDFILTVVCDEHGFTIHRNGYLLGHFERRLDPETITQVTIQGDVLPLTMKYLTDKPVFEEAGIYWRQMGGHLAKVETCDAGVTWGLAWDATPWVYTGGYIGLLNSKEGIGTVTDSQEFELYENQRWFPITGYSCRGLPTDRPSWSDITGTEKRSKDSCVLVNSQWHWETEWSVDYNIQGGTDKEGWQYALDFPCTYHASNSVTDTVRRRKWIRRARFISQGPWLEVGNTKLRDLSVHTDSSGNIHVWGVVHMGDVLYRRGVSVELSSGIAWEHVSHDETIVSISGLNLQVWGVGQNGCAYWRYGVTSINSMGEHWKCIDPPKKASLVQISVGDHLIFVRDSEGYVYTRLGVSSVCREGTHWQLVADVKMKTICVNRKEVWAITMDGNLTKRLGATKDHPVGYTWVLDIPGNWDHISVKR